MPEDLTLIKRTVAWELDSSNEVYVIGLREHRVSWS